MDLIHVNCSAELAWIYIWNQILFGKTNLFYDFRVSNEAGANISHLPGPELIQKQIPNPCSWGTGMEDSFLNGAMILDAYWWMRRIHT